MHYKIEHLFYFSPDSIKYLLFQKGFKIIDISPAYKALTLEYLYYQLKTYPVPVLTQIISILKSIAGKIAQKTIELRGGEMLVIAKNLKGEICGQS